MFVIMKFNSLIIFIVISLLFESCFNDSLHESNPIFYEPEMIFVEGGGFMMGQNVDGSHENPVHKVILSSFYIGKYEVTQSQWREIVGSNPSSWRLPSILNWHLFVCNDCPVDYVSWHEIQDFIQKLNTRTGKLYRLPTEAEWEFAAKGGNKSEYYTYSGGDDFERVANHQADGHRGEFRNYYTYPVGQMEPNELGIYDMSGNASELCSDWFAEYIEGQQSNPSGPTSGEFRVCRGGDWQGPICDFRVTSRTRRNPHFKHVNGGFRLALSSGSQ
jgi:formylglycine-generating enzyme required for sulfatase activity